MARFRGRVFGASLGDRCDAVDLDVIDDELGLALDRRVQDLAGMGVKGGSPDT
jgi:hypothetical protein